MLGGVYQHEQLHAMWNSLASWYHHLINQLTVSATNYQNHHDSPLLVGNQGRRYQDCLDKAHTTMHYCGNGE